MHSKTHPGMQGQRWPPTAALKKGEEQASPHCGAPGSAVIKRGEGCGDGEGLGTADFLEKTTLVPVYTLA